MTRGRKAPPLEPIPTDPVWLTISQLCDRWQLSRKTVYKFISANVLPVWKVGAHLYRVAMSDVLSFEAQNRLSQNKLIPPALRTRRRIG